LIVIFATSDCICKPIERGLPVRDRTQRLTTYYACFYGREFVDWALAQPELALRTRAAATSLGVMLMYR
jgi:hypothetical protein